MPKTVLEMVADCLRENGYDGLYSADFECACELGDLAPCGDMQDDCAAGYKRVLTAPEDGLDAGDWVIQSDKVEQPAKAARRRQHGQT